MNYQPHEGLKALMGLVTIFKDIKSGVYKVRGLYDSFWER
jgi:hypothetical protein